MSKAFDMVWHDGIIFKLTQNETYYYYINFV